MAESCSGSLSAADGRVAFTRGEGPSAGIVTVNADGSELAELVEPGDPRSQPHLGTEGPRWLSDGRLLFSSNRAGGPDDWHLFVVEPDGQLEQLTSGADAIEYHGVMSTDGATLAYAKAVATGDSSQPFREAGIFLSDADGSNERQLTMPPADGTDEWPDFSTDGDWIVFGRGGQDVDVEDSGIFVIGADGSGLRRIVDGTLQPLRPRWSPDGSMVAFSSNADRFTLESANVWVGAADGSGLRQVTHASGDAQAWAPDWSPTGEWLVYANHLEGSATQDLAIVDLAGHRGCRLVAGTTLAVLGDPDWASLR